MRCTERMGTTEAFDEFCRAEHGRVVGALLLLCGEVGLAEEIAQTAFERAWARWDRVSAMVSPGGWVQQVAFNLARSGLRRRAAERRAMVRHGPTAAQQPVDSAVVVTVRAALLALPPRQREAVVHRHHLGRSVAETAAVMGTSEGAVKQLTLRGSVTLRALLAKDGGTLPAAAQEVER